SISGTMPYFAGLKMVECSAIRNSTPSISSMRVEKNAARASSITKISKTLTDMRMVRLLTASARRPEDPENRRNGSTNTAPESARYKLLGWVPDATWTARRETMILYTLSLKAPRNWVHRKD